MGGTVCPGGCCPEVNWFCCADNLHCAATESDCPFWEAKQQLVKLAKEKNCEGTTCPAGCCAEENWFCCSDDRYYAATESDCPTAKYYQHLFRLKSKLH